MRFVGPPPLLALLVALAPALFAPGARATPEPTPSELSVARHLFDEGRAAEDAGRWHEAAERFRQATTIKDTPGMRFHLARCEEEQGAFVEALVEYDRARELIDGGIRASDVEKLLADARERVRAKVALLTLRLPDGVQNVSVELNGKPLSASVLGAPMPINPGKHGLRAVAVGRTTFASELTLATGEVKQLAIELPISTTVPLVASAPAPTPEPPPAAAVSVTPDALASKPPRLRTVVVVSELSLGLVGLATGIVFTVARSSANDRMRTANDLVLEQVGGSDPNGTACGMKVAPSGCADLNQAEQDRTRDGTLATVGFVTAGASAAAIGLTYWLWPRSEPPAELGAGAGPGRFDLVLSGRF
ncbi:MAG TPA: tetratricopeptide repeat protein [Polyangiaceae bacterium]|nr:tetratricopeptide repeat protein [Polyangiaceae bacterium]